MPSLNYIGNVRFGENKGFAGNPDDALVRTATSGWRQPGGGSFRDVDSDHGKITILKLPNVRATGATNGFCSVLVRVGTESAKEYELRIHVAMTIEETPEKCKNKIPAIAGLYPAQASATLSIVAAHPANRKSLGQAIRNYRKKAKLTQERLGELANLNPKYIGEVERMEKTISVDSLARIAASLKVRLRDLVRDA